jgi:hypothetical protein
VQREPGPRTRKVTTYKKRVEYIGYKINFQEWTYKNYTTTVPAYSSIAYMNIKIIKNNYLLSYTRNESGAFATLRYYIFS